MVGRAHIAPPLRRRRAARRSLYHVRRWRSCARARAAAGLGEGEHNTLPSPRRARGCYAPPVLVDDPGASTRLPALFFISPRSLHTSFPRMAPPPPHTSIIALAFAFALALTRSLASLHIRRARLHRTHARPHSLSCFTPFHLRRSADLTMIPYPFILSSPFFCFIYILYSRCA